MRSFKDNTGRTWQCVVTVGVARSVRDQLGVNLLDLAETLPRLAEDPVLLVDVIYLTVKERCDTLGVTPEDFGRSMAGDPIEHATDALLEAITDFFPSRQRMIWKKTLATTATLADEILQNAENEIGGKSSSGSLASRALTRVRSLPGSFAGLLRRAVNPTGRTRQNCWR